MNFDPHWPDDPRDRDDRGRELSQGSRGGLSNPRERLPLDTRDIFTRDLELPRGRERERVWENAPVLSGSELIEIVRRRPVWDELTITREDDAQFPRASLSWHEGRGLVVHCFEDEP